MAAEKKKLKFKIEVDLLDERDPLTKYDFKEEARTLITQNSKLAKQIKPLTFDFEAEVDPREWDEKKLTKAAYEHFNGGVKMFDQRVKKSGGDESKVKGFYKTLVDQSGVQFDKWVKELESGKADSEKAMKAGNAALDKLNSLDLKGVFQKPCESALKALKPLQKGNADKSAVKAANSALAETKLDFANFGDEAKEAVKFLITTGKQMKDDKKADPALQSFGKDVLKMEPRLQPMVTGAEDLKKGLEEGIQATEADTVDPKAMQKLYEKFQKLASLEKLAQDAIAVAKKLTPQFKKIVGDIEAKAKK